MQTEAQGATTFERKREATVFAADSFRGMAAHSLNKGIFFLLLSLIVLTAVPYGTVDPWWDALFQSGVFGLTILWAIEGALAGTFRVSGKRFLLPLSLLVVFIFFQTLPLWSASGAALESDALQPISLDPVETARMSYKVLALMLTLGLLLTYTSNRRRLRALTCVVIGIGVASALFGITQQILSYADITLLSSVRESGYAQFVTHHHFAYLMEMGLGLTFGLLAGGGVRRKHLPFYLAGAIIMLAALVAAESRGGIVGLLCALFFLALAFSAVQPFAASEVVSSGAPDQPLRSLVSSVAVRLLVRLRQSLPVRIALVICLLATLIIGMTMMSGEPVVGRLRQTTGEVSLDENPEIDVRRGDMWRASSRVISANPYFGVGFGAYWIAATEYYTANGNYTVYQAHNDYLELLASGGIIAVILAAWFIFVVIRQAHRCLTRSINTFRRASCYGALAGLFAVAVHSFFNFGLHITINSLIFIVLIAISVLDVDVASDEMVNGESDSDEYITPPSTAALALRHDDV